MRRSSLVLSLLLLLHGVSAAAAVAQTAAAPQAQAATAADESAAAAQDGAPADGAPADGAQDEDEPHRGDEGFLPRLDVYFPEGDLDLRVNRLVNQVFFEGQVKYNFIDGDISAFLRYRYYGFKRVYQLTGFDSLEFDNLEQFSDEFERVRGFLVLTQWPHDYHHRTSLLAEIDRIISNKTELQFDNNRTNTYVRLGYQIGTPNDTRSNAVVGERRAEVERLFTPYRKIGPGDAGLSAAATWGFDFGIGDFDYVKVEAEGLKRVDLPRGEFLVGRVHAGTFPVTPLRPGAEDRDEADRYTIPRSELFRLDGRTNLKGVSERVRGTEQLYATVELFHPWFEDEDRRALWLNWETWYWVLYSGLGTTGFDTSVYTDWSTYYPDLGLGFESAFRLKKYRFFLSGVVARAFAGEGDVQARLSIKSYR